MKYFFLFVFTMLPVSMFPNGPKRIAQQATKASALPAPVVLPATNVSSNGFDANWKAVPGAEAYCVYVYTKHQAQADETYTVLEEDFSLINFGTVTNPVWSEEIYEKLDGYTNLPDWSIYGFASYARGMVSGVIFTPYMDLRNDEGAFDVRISIYGLPKDVVYVRSNGSGVATEIKSAELTKDGSNEATLSFTNGVRDTYLHIHNADGTYYYLDDISVSQKLKRADETLTMIALNEEVTDGQLTASFGDLSYRKGAEIVYYAVYAVARDYDSVNTGAYTQYYSDFSDLMAVNLQTTKLRNEESETLKVSNSTGELYLSCDQNMKAQIYTIQGKQIRNFDCLPGDNHIPLNSGIYLLKVGGEVYKVLIK